MKTKRQTMKLFTNKKNDNNYIYTVDLFAKL